jgi:hypothetical protein
VTTKAAPPRVLDAQERVAEVLFGLIMALSFTGTIQASIADREEVRLVLIAALGCNVAWGLIDAVMFLVSQLVYRGRELHTWRRFARATDDAGRRAALTEEVPAAVVALLQHDELEQLHAHAEQQVREQRVRLHWHDLRGALAVCLLVIVATFPVVLPYFFIVDLATAKRISNLVSILLLFAAGAALGRFSGGKPLWIGLSMVAIGVLLVGVTIALGG